MPGYFSSYDAGKFSGKGENHVMFSFYRLDRTPGQSLLVQASKASAEHDAIIRNGWLPLPRS